MRKNVLIGLVAVFLLTSVAAFGQAGQTSRDVLIGASVGAAVGQQVACRIGSCTYNKMTLGGLIGGGIGAAVGAVHSKKHKRVEEREAERVPDESAPGGKVGKPPPAEATACSGPTLAIRNSDVDTRPFTIFLANGLANRGWCYQPNNAEPQYIADIVLRDVKSSWESGQEVYGGMGSQSDIKARGLYQVAFMVFRSDGTPVPTSSASTYISLRQYKQGYTMYSIGGYAWQRDSSESTNDPREEAARLALQYMLQ